MVVTLGAYRKYVRSVRGTEIVKKCTEMYKGKVVVKTSIYVRFSKNSN